MMSETDVELMLRVRRGDKDAFRQLVDRHKSAVINFIHRAIGNRWEAEDLAQVVFLNIYNSAHRYKPSAKFNTWLYTVARNTCLNEIRRRSRHPAQSLDAMLVAEEDSPARTLPDTTARTPAEETVATELENRIRAAICSLPEEQRTAITLLRYEGLSYEEIAEVLRRSVGATKSIIHRARLTLKKQLKPYLRGE